MLTGTHINYYFTCRRKLWLFSRSITCEWDSDIVKVGKFYHEDLEGVSIDNIKIDMIKKGKVWELKKTSRNKIASRYQVLYYLLVLKGKGITTSGIIRYEENNSIEEIILTPEAEEELYKIIGKINQILELENPPLPKRKKICKKCSYYQLCFV